MHEDAGNLLASRVTKARAPVCCSALAEDMGEPPAAELVQKGGELKDMALVPARVQSCPSCWPPLPHETIIARVQVLYRLGLQSSGRAQQLGLNTCRITSRADCAD